MNKILLALLLVFVPVSALGQTWGSFTPGKLISTGTTQDATIIKAKPGVLGFVTASNVNAAPMFLKFYDKATAPTSSDTPKFTFLIPGGAAGAGTNVGIPFGGIEFLAGISFRLVTTVPDNGNTGVAAAEVVVNYGYK